MSPCTRTHHRINSIFPNMSDQSDIPVLRSRHLSIMIPCFATPRNFIHDGQLNLRDVVKNSVEIKKEGTFADHVTLPVELPQDLLKQVNLAHNHVFCHNMDLYEIMAICEEYVLCIKNSPHHDFFQTHIICGFAGMFWNSETDQLIFPFTFPTQRGGVDLDYACLSDSVESISSQYGNLPFLAGKIS